MRKVPLKTVTADFTALGGGEDQEICYGESMMAALRRPKDPRSSTTPGEMRVALPIMDKIDKAMKDGAKCALLEEAEHKEVSERMENFPFAFNDQVILDMVDEIKGSPEASVAEVHPDEEEAA